MGGIMGNLLAMYCPDCDVINFEMSSINVSVSVCLTVNLEAIVL